MSITESKTHKEPKLKITPANAKVFRTIALEMGIYTPDRAYNKQIYLENLLEKMYSEQPGAKYTYNGVTYRLGDCMVCPDGYSWFFGYGYVFNDEDEIPIWEGLRTYQTMS